MAERPVSVIPAEADVDRAPGLLAGAMSLDLTPQACNLEYWPIERPRRIDSAPVAELAARVTDRLREEMSGDAS